MWMTEAALDRDMIAEIDDNIEVLIRRLHSGEAQDRQSVLSELHKLQAQRVQELEPSFFKDLDRFR